MSKVYKLAIIGCGGIANGKHLPSLKKLKNVEIVAFCDIVEQRAIDAAAQYGAEDAKVYTDYTELLNDSSIEVVHVCTPNDSHANIAIAALEAGKHVMTEKPMAKTAHDAQRMVDAARRTGKKLTVGYNNRFRPDSQHLKNCVKLVSLVTSTTRKRMLFVAVQFQLGAFSLTKKNKAADRLSISVLTHLI